MLGIAKDFGVPLLAAIVGALLAYVPSSRLARQSAAEMLRRDREQRIEAELAQVRQAFVKLTLIGNTLGSFDKQVEEMILRAERDGNGRMPLWQRMSTFAGIEDEAPITFCADELAPFIAARRPDVVDALLLLQRRYAAVLQSLRTFARLKTEVHYECARHGVTTRDANLVSTTRATMPRGDANALILKMDELEIFSSAACTQLAEYSKHAAEVAGLFDEVSQAYFGSCKIPALELVETETPKPA